MRKIAIHYVLAIALGLIVFLLSYVLMLIPGIGYGVFTVVFALIFFAQGTFYRLTFVHSTVWSTASFVLNFILWTTEFVQLEHLLDDTSMHRLLYHNDSYYWLRFVLGGLLWSTNKLVLDKVIDMIIGKSAATVSSG
jgi:hypothetical protein